MLQITAKITHKFTPGKNLLKETEPEGKAKAIAVFIPCSLQLCEVPKG
jgi:hypothetical protein